VASIAKSDAIGQTDWGIAASERILASDMNVMKIFKFLTVAFFPNNGL
jgi:hypothetical protein